MGTRLAPCDTNLFMGRLVEKILNKLEQNVLKPALYLRYRTFSSSGTKGKTN